MIKGKQSIAFKASPYIEESASVVGKKEGEGPLGSRFDMVGLDDMFGEDTWEKAESSMQKEACQLALGKAHLTAGAIRGRFIVISYPCSVSFTSVFIKPFDSASFFTNG